MNYKLLIDHNLSTSIPLALSDLFPESKHVHELSLSQATDKQLFDFAGDQHFTIITKDKDFYHLVNTFGPPPKIIWMAIGNATNRRILEVIRMHEREIKEFIRSKRSILVIQGA